MNCFIFSDTVMHVLKLPKGDRLHNLWLPTGDKVVKRVEELYVEKLKQEILRYQFINLYTV